MIYKVIPSSWDFGVEPTAMVKVARSGFGAGDRRDLRVKRATANQLEEILRKCALGAGDLPIHTIAIGATEAYGSNRNGDGFCEDTCRKQASTFNSYPLRDYSDDRHNGARFFQNHKNDDPANSYGYVKAAFYNDDMRRIELLVIGNETKEAAERNGGHKMPDELIDKLHRGEFMAGSMACKVAYDVCSICNNKAPTRKHYCTEDSCVGEDGVHGFGCKTGLTRLLKTGRQQFVENPGAMFFDWSKVARPAERTAYGGVVDGFTKAASYGDVVLGGAWLAEHYGVGMGAVMWDTPLSEFQQKQVKLAHQLADVEAELSTLGPRDLATCLAFSPVVQTPLSLADFVGQPGTTKYASALRALAEAGVVISPRDFCFGNSYSAANFAGLPGMFRKLAADPDLPRLLNNAYSRILEGRPTQVQKSFATKVAETRSVCCCNVEKRAKLAVLRGCDYSQRGIKSAGYSASGDDSLARQYALYQLATLATMPEHFQSPLTLRTVVLQNTGIA